MFHPLGFQMVPSVIPIHSPLHDSMTLDSGVGLWNGRNCIHILYRSSRMCML